MAAGLFLLSTSSPAVAQGRGGGAGASDDSGVTDAGPGRRSSQESKRTEASADTGSARSPDSSSETEQKSGSRAEEKQDSGEPNARPGTSGSEKQPETTGGGR